MSKLIFQCENGDVSNKSEHNGEIFYCRLCKLSVCTTCLINHLCLKPHNDPNYITKMTEVFKKTQNTINSLSSQLAKSFKDFQINQNLGTSLSEELTTKKAEIYDNFLLSINFLQKAQVMMENSLNELINEEKQKRMNVKVPEDVKEIEGEYFEIQKNLVVLSQKISDETNGNKLIKEWIEGEKKVHDFVEKMNKTKQLFEKNNPYIEYAAKIKEKMKMYDSTFVLCANQQILEEIESKFSTNNNNFINNNNNNSNAKSKIDLEDKDDVIMQDKLKQKLFPFQVKTVNQPQIVQISQINQGNNNCPSLAAKFTVVENEKAKNVIQNLQNCEKKPSYIYPYTSEYLICLNLPDLSNLREIILYNSKSHTYHTVQLREERFLLCYTPHFPFKHCKYTNVGNNTIIITGGFVDTSISNKVFRLTVSADLIPQITLLKPLIFARQGHNILYLPKQNYVVVCGGQFCNSSEFLNLSDLNNEWKSLGDLSKPRANGTMAVINESYVFCFGGFNHKDESYISSYEMINIDKYNEGWKEVHIDEMALSTMGVIMIDTNQILFVGGFKGGKKYSNEGLLVTFNNKSEIEKIVKKEEIVKKGLIFYCSQQFFKCGDNLVNFDFKNYFFTYNKELDQLIPEKR